MLTWASLANLRHCRRYAREHKQSFPERRAIRFSTRQDRQFGSLGTGIQKRRQSCEEADVVERHEDAHLLDRWYHHLAASHHRPCW